MKFGCVPRSIFLGSSTCLRCRRTHHTLRPFLKELRERTAAPHERDETHSASRHRLMRIHANRSPTDREMNISAPRRADVHGRRRGFGWSFADSPVHTVLFRTSVAIWQKSDFPYLFGFWQKSYSRKNDLEGATSCGDVSVLRA